MYPGTGICQQVCRFVDLSCFRPGNPKIAKLMRARSNFIFLAPHSFIHNDFNSSLPPPFLRHASNDNNQSDCAFEVPPSSWC